MTTTQPRPIREIAIDIRQHWPKVYYGAEPYLAAMFELCNITDNYYQDSARSILEYFLANATTFRGEDARRLKAEIKALLGR